MVDKSRPVFHGFSSSEKDFGVCPYCHRNLPLIRVEEDIEAGLMCFTFLLSCSHCNQVMAQMMSLPFDDNLREEMHRSIKHMFAEQSKPCPHKRHKRHGKNGKSK